METQGQQNITSLKAANDELLTKVSELKNNFSSVKGDKENCLKNLNECQSKTEHMETQNQQNTQNITSLQAANDELINKNRLLLQDANDLKSKLLIKEDKINNLLEKMAELQKNLDESKKLSDEREKRLAIAEQMNELKDKLLQNEQNNCNSNDKIKNLMGKLDEVSSQIESFKNVKGKNAAQNQATDNEQKTDGECLTLFYGPQQRPIILSN